jgi:hypothetical protein
MLTFGLLTRTGLRPPDDQRPGHRGRNRQATAQFADPTLEPPRLPIVPAHVGRQELGKVTEDVEMLTFGLLTRTGLRPPDDQRPGHRGRNRQARPRKRYLSISCRLCCECTMHRRCFSFEQAEKVLRVRITLPSA